MTVKRILSAAWWLALALGGAVGCAEVGPQPLTAERVNQSLTPPALEVVRIKASEIHHPLLRPVVFEARDGLSPDEAAVLAVIVNPALRAARDQRGVASAQVLQAGILPNPAVTAGIDQPITGTGNVAAYNVGVTWEFTALLSHEAKVAAARDSAAAVDLDIAWQEWQVAQAARSAVYSCVGLRTQLDTAREEEFRRRENAALLRRAVEQHQKTIVDQSAAEAAWEESRTVVLELEGQLAKQRLLLNKALGLPAEQKVALRQDIVLSGRLELPTQEELLHDLENRRLDLVALRRGYGSQEATLRAAVLGQFPKISLGLNHTRDYGDFYTLGPILDFDLPIFDRNQGQIAIEKATRQKLFDEYVNRLFEARSDLATLRAEIDATTAQIAAAEEAMPVLVKLAETYRGAFETGNADILIYYGVLGDLAKKRLDLLKLKQTLAELGVELEIAAGRYLPAPPQPQTTIKEPQR